MGAEPGSDTRVPKATHPRPMDCQNFRRLHSDYIDRTLSKLLAAAVYLHLEVCESCARRDAVLRRGLFLVRNLTQIRPSAGFARKLEQRLDAEREHARGRTLAPRRGQREPSIRFAGALPSPHQRAALS